MPFFKNLYLLLFIGFCFSISAYSQNKIEMQDSTLLVGERYLLPVYANLKVQKGDTVRVIIRAIKGLRFGYNLFTYGNSNSLMDSLGPFNSENKLFKSSTSFDSSQVDISFIVSNPNALKLFDLELYTSAGKDSTDTIIPAELYINGKFTKFTAKKGIYKFNSFIYKRNEDRLEYSYPNPFTERTIVNFTLSKDSDVKFKLFSENGRLIDELPNTQNEIEYYLREAGADSNNSSKPFINGVSTFKLEKSTYELTLLRTFKLAAGGYVLVMLNDDKASSIKLLYEK